MTMEAAGELDADLLIVDGRIDRIGPALDRAGREVVDATGCWVLPGFVDSHRHGWQSALRFIGSGWDVDTYFSVVHGCIAPQVTPRDTHLGDLLAGFACLDGGITTMCDEAHAQYSPEHTEAIIEAHRLTGIRARFGYGYGWGAGAAHLAAGSGPHPLDMERVRADLLPDDLAVVTMYAMLRGPAITGMAVGAADLARARALDLRSSMHDASVGSHAPTEIEMLAEAGLLGPDLTVIHGGGAGPDELRLLSDAGGGLSVAPVIESRMRGVGLPILAAAHKAGLRPGLSGDTELAVSGDMFGCMRAADLTKRVQRIGGGTRADEGPATSAIDLLPAATIDEAHAAGCDDLVGSLAIGKRADIVLIDRTAPNLISCTDSATAIVTAAHAGNVVDVLVDGVRRKRSRRLVDREALSRAADDLQESAERLIAAGRRSPSWTPDRG